MHIIYSVPNKLVLWLHVWWWYYPLIYLPRRVQEQAGTNIVPHSSNTFLYKTAYHNLLFWDKYILCGVLLIMRQPQQWQWSLRDAKSLFYPLVAILIESYIRYTTPPQKTKKKTKKNKTFKHSLCINIPQICYWDWFRFARFKSWFHSNRSLFTDNYMFSIIIQT